MNKSVIVLILGLLCLTARAIPADPTPARVTQPDGSMLTVVLHGDEFFHFTTTADGYTVVKNTAGFYTYARLDGDRLVAGDRIAHDATDRSAGDRAMLSTMPKMLTGKEMQQTGTSKLNRRNSAMRRVGAEGESDYQNFKGLIILINYTDKRFSMSDPNAFYDDMVNTHDFTGYTLKGRKVSMTGSVRDYFYDNSFNMFDPVFDVVGPVNVSFNCQTPQGTAAADRVFNAALNLADDLVDFSDYDSDNDGVVDMVFFLVAGFSANYGGNNENYLWPHMYYLYRTPPHDGMYFGLYACSTEIAGWEGYWSDVNGIGTFCHEFSHVLGLPDLYDTDYSGNGGESQNPGNWSIMAGGSGDNFGRNPVGYSLYERYALGFATPKVLEKEGNYELQPLDESNEGYRLNTYNPDEYFLIENRQDGKWDKFLPGHGMLIARVDSSDTYVWWSNEVNCDPNHMYYELLRAYNVHEDGPSDPFPGAAGVTSITNYTRPSLRSYNHFFSDLVFYDIAENDRVISFNAAVDDSYELCIEDFEAMMTTGNRDVNVLHGSFCDWKFSKCSLSTPDAENCNGLYAVAMRKPSNIMTAEPLRIKPFAASFSLYNPTSAEAKIRLSYSVDQGETWVHPDNGTCKVAGYSHGSAFVELPTTEPIIVRFAQIAGKEKVDIYLDDIKFYYNEKWPILGDVNCDEELTLLDVNCLIDMILDDSTNEFGDVNGDGETNIADVNMIIDLLLRR